jgi:uncharacterized protein (TIGR00369 family)
VPSGTFGCDPDATAEAAMSLTETINHHELCFGCGIANLFGLQMEVERHGDGCVVGRFFLKQDHQGPPNHAHGGVVSAALDEAMALVLHAEGIVAVSRRLEVDFLEPAPVGTFVRVEARIERREGRKAFTTASARTVGEGRTTLAAARGVFIEVEHG